MLNATAKGTKQFSNTQAFSSALASLIHLEHYSLRPSGY